MARGFYRKLAVNSIKRNRQTYLPYLLTCICTVALFYIIISLATSSDLERMVGGSTLRAILNFGAAIVGLFSVIFLFYTNSFLVKRRKKEFGLFNILGMEKKHIAKIVFWETTITAALALSMGLLGGILFSKLVFLLFLGILEYPVVFGFELSIPGMFWALALFSAIFLLTLLNALRQVHLAKPIELLKGGQVGEREPKTKWLSMICGLAFLGAGYYLALSIESPLAALQIFFVAAVLVMGGTYLLFTAGSIGLLKLLRRNRRVYYRPRSFISISGMIYRMKQNAVGLANICILATMILVTLSATISLYIGVDDALKTRYPQDLTLSTSRVQAEDVAEVRERTWEIVKRHGLTAQNVEDYRSLGFIGSIVGSTFEVSGARLDSINPDYQAVELIPLEDLREFSGSLDLEENEVLIYSPGKPYGHTTITVLGRTFTIKQQLDSLTAGSREAVSVVNSHVLVVKDMEVLESLYAAQEGALGHLHSEISHYLGFDLEGSPEEKTAVYSELRAALPQSWVESRDASRTDFYHVYGGLFFLGLFLGTLFGLGTVLIIYYKQVTEGFEDKRRFAIMQQVGMSRAEVRGTVRSQVLMVFFLPLITAGIHVAFAFKMISRLLAVFNLTNIPLYALCTVGVFLGFGVLYTLVYAITARVYSKIVEQY